LEIFTQRNFAADFILLKLAFILKNEKNRPLTHRLEDLGVTYALGSVGIPVHDPTRGYGYGSGRNITGTGICPYFTCELGVIALHCIQWHGKN